EHETIEKEDLVKVLAGVEKQPQRAAEQRGAGLAVSRRAVRAQQQKKPGTIP
ncbi:MAG: hypothetical protein HYU54_10260, partial [Actinobacteria bacterium]|nr:hypothetical protein [Actinomycetota bacterium]